MEAASEEEKVKKTNLAIVAGGANFLGIALCQELLEQGFSVICLDNLSHGTRENIENLLQNPKFSFQQEDLASPSFKLPPAIKPTHVFHLASVEIHTTDERPSLNTLLINSVGTKNLLDIAVEKKAKFIFLSSPDVFHAASPQNSLDSLFAKEVKTENLAFAEGKRFGEILIAEYYKKYDLDAVVVRIKDPYGPAMPLDAKSILSNLIEEALERGKIEILGDGLQTANPTFSSDIIDGLLKVAFSSTKGEIFQLINPDRYTEKAIAEQLKLVLGNVEIIQKKKTPILDQGQVLILEETQEKLGWAPKISLEEGLNQTIVFFKQEKTKQVKSEEKPLAAEKEKTKVDKRTILRLAAAFFVAALIGWVLVFPLVSIAANTFFGERNLSVAVDSLKNEAKTSQPESSAKKAEENFITSEISMRNISWLSRFPPVSKAVNGVGSYLFLGENLSKAVKYAIQGAGKINHAAAKQTNKETAKQDLLEAQRDFEQARISLETYSSVSLNEKDLPANMKGSLQKINKEKQTVEKFIEKTEINLQKLL